MVKLVHDGSESAVPGGSAAGSSLLEEIVRDGARRMLAAALQAEVTAYVDQFADEFDVLLAFYEFPAEHWIHLRTTNPIESTFVTVGLRRRVTRGPESLSRAHRRLVGAFASAVHA